MWKVVEGKEVKLHLDFKIFHTLCAEMCCYINPEDGNEDVYAEMR